MRPRQLGSAAAAGVATFLVVFVAVAEALLPYVEFSALVGIPAGLVAGALVTAFVLTQLGGEADRTRRRLARALGAFGVALLVAFALARSRSARRLQSSSRSPSDSSAGSPCSCGAGRNPMRPRPVFTSVRARTQTLVGATVIVALLAAGAFVLPRAVPGITDPAWIRARIEAYGSLAPLVFVLLQAAQVVLAPVPGQLLALVGGYLFGTVHGTVYSLTGAALGSTVAFLIARRYGRPFVERVITAETLAAFDGIASRDGRFALFLAFLVPGLPDDAICFVAGITRLPLWQLVGISVVGRVPGYLLVSFAGAQLAQANYVETTVVLAALAAVSALVYWRKDAILARLS